VSVIDGTTNKLTATIPAGAHPGELDVNPVTNKIYVFNNGDGSTSIEDSLTVIDGATNTTTSIGFHDLQFGGAFVRAPLVVNPVANKIYVVAPGMLIDGATNAIIGTPSCAAFAVNSTTNKFYGVPSNPNVASLCEIDGAFNTSTSVFNFTNFSSRPVVNPVTNTVYASDVNNVIAVAEQQVSAIPLTTVITPLPNNVTANPAQAFTFTTSSSYGPTVPAVQNVYYQVDTWQGPWLEASGTAPTFTGQMPMLQTGAHILFAYAADAQFGDGQSGPVIGQIRDYIFAVTNPNTVVQLSSSANPSKFHKPVTFTAAVTSSSGTPSGTVNFSDGSTLLGTGTLDAAGIAKLTTSNLAVGTHSITASFSGGGAFSPAQSNTVLQVVKPGEELDLAIGTSSATVKPGQAAIFNFIVNASVSGVVTLQCSGLPQGATCGFSPVSPANNGATAETMTIQTSAPLPFAMNRPRSPLQKAPLSIAMVMTLPVAGLLYVGLGNGRRKKKGTLFRLVLLGGMLLVGALVLALAGCGGLLREIPAEELPTPPGVYSITVTATSGNMSAQYNIALTVTP
jgi:hypothetical protein